MLASIENRLVYIGAYQADKRLSKTPADYGLTFERVSIRAEDGVHLMAWLLPNPNSQYWLLYFHGQGENVSRYLPLTTRLAKHVNVLSLEYRGYGESEGKPSEKGLYLDAQAAYHFLRSQNIQPAEIIAYGYSLGSGVAVDLASKLELAALILEAAYTSLPAAAKHLYRIAPGKLIRNRFDSLSKIAKVKVPIAFIHAKDDLMIPYEQGQRLFDATQSPKLFISVKGGHVAMLEQPQTETLNKLLDFLHKHLSLI